MKLKFGFILRRVVYSPHQIAARIREAACDFCRGDTDGQPVRPRVSRQFVHDQRPAICGGRGGRRRRSRGRLAEQRPRGVGLWSFRPAVQRGECVRGGGRKSRFRRARGAGRQAMRRVGAVGLGAREAAHCVSTPFRAGPPRDARLPSTAPSAQPATSARARRSSPLRPSASVSSRRASSLGRRV